MKIFGVARKVKTTIFAWCLLFKLLLTILQSLSVTNGLLGDMAEAGPPIPPFFPQKKFSDTYASARNPMALPYNAGRKKISNIMVR